jgi:hypothetical protein
MLAEKMGDSTTANTYLDAAKNIQNTILNHYNGQYIIESTNREKDAAVINGLNNGYLNDGFLAPTDYRVSGTISTLNDVFNTMFAINTFDTQAGLGGILYGRYQGMYVYLHSISHFVLFFLFPFSSTPRNLYKETKNCC